MRLPQTAAIKSAGFATRKAVYFNCANVSYGRRFVATATRSDSSAGRTFRGRSLGLRPGASEIFNLFTFVRHHRLARSPN